LSSLTKIDRKAWQFVSQNGTNEEVLDFLKTENLQRIDLEMIAFRMQDSAFFRASQVCWPRGTSTIRRCGHTRSSIMWPEQVQVYLEHANDFVCPVRRVPQQSAAED